MSSWAIGGSTVSDVSTRRVYKRPPIVEAVCEVRFASDEWDPTIAGRLQERLRSRYSGKPQEQQILQANVRKSSGDMNGPGLEVQGQQSTRVQLRDEDGTRLVSVGRDVLSISDLAPYSGWEDYRERIAEAIATFDELASPTRLLRIGLRYINRVTVTRSVVELDDFFTVDAQVPPGGDLTVRSFLSRSTSTYPDGVELTLTFASTEAGDDESAFVLDLDLAMAEGLLGDVSFADCLTVIDDLRERERNAFESCITETAREAFDED